MKRILLTVILGGWITFFNPSTGDWTQGYIAGDFREGMIYDPFSQQTEFYVFDRDWLWFVSPQGDLDGMFWIDLEKFFRKH